MSISLDVFKKGLDAALAAQTIYAMGGLGTSMKNKNVWSRLNKQEYNKQPDRQEKLKAVDKTDTFIFDCQGMVLAALSGFTANKNANYNYGGAAYTSDFLNKYQGATNLNKHCKNVSEDFSNIEPFELVFTSKQSSGAWGHVGVYIGNDKVQECTPSWKDGVQITNLNNIKNHGSPGRKWVCHGKLDILEYPAAIKQETAPAPKKEEKSKALFSVLDWQRAAVADGFKPPKYFCEYGTDGFWGIECEAVARVALVKKQLIGYKNQNLTKIVQKIVGVTVDGKCGKDTKAAIEKWQKANRLTVDGIVGLNSWKKMRELGLIK